MVGVKRATPLGRSYPFATWWTFMVRTACILPAVLLLASGPVFAIDVDFQIIPRPLQLFGRDTEDSARVIVSGVVRSTGHDSIRLETYKDGELWDVRSDALRYIGSDGASFSLGSGIHAELAEYRIRVLVDDIEVAQRDSLLCGDVYLINGQSNAVAGDSEGQAHSRSEWLRSFGTSSLSGNVVAADTLWSLAQGRTVYDHGAIGVWGLWLGETLVERHGIPVAILNGAQGGTPIVQFLRNDNDPMDLGTLYGRLLWRTEKAGVQQNVKAILWHQGESDSDGQWSYYLDRFTVLWNAWREDYVPLDKVYVFQIHPGCGSGHQSEMRELQRTFPELFPDLDVMSTVGIVGHDGCHYGFDGYNQMGSWVSRLIDRDFYGSSDTLRIVPPNVVRAFYTTHAMDEIRIDFDGDVVWPADTLGASMNDYIYLDGAWGLVESGKVTGDGKTVIVRLTEPVSATTLTYLPNVYYHDTSVTYEGPWIRNPRGVGALSFYEFPIADLADVFTDVDGDPQQPLSCRPNPFRSSIRIRFRLRDSRWVGVRLFDAGGRMVRVLANRYFDAGSGDLLWDGMDQNGHQTPAGVYFVRLEMLEGATVRRIVGIR